MIKYLIILLSGAGLLACSSVNTISAESELVPVTDEYAVSSKVDSMILPYREGLKSEMNEVIAKAEKGFTSGRPNGSLNNWATDVVLVSQTRNVRLSIPVMVILNFGGLRNSINQGDVTIGDIYKVMPFDNEIVWAELPISALKDIEAYLINSGGEPIAGATLQNGSLTLNSENSQAETFLVITSDYLLNGGDKMTFFEKRVSDNSTGVLLRDAMISEAKSQGTLIWSEEERIKL
jgi:2',3'-cyclic-nucleotide 2'-phosphodiesterase (5'-nucleotidase family)